MGRPMACHLRVVMSSDIPSSPGPTGETRTIHNTYIPQQLVISIGWEKAVREAVRPELGGAVT
jgi:hypothetical protein